MNNRKHGKKESKLWPAHPVHTLFLESRRSHTPQYFSNPEDVMPKNMELLLPLILVVIVTAAPCMAETYFQTSWNLATGNSNEAVTDGYTFNGSYSTSMLNVETGGVAGNNLYGIWMKDQAWAGVWAQGLPIDKYDDFYYRFHIRVYPKNGMTYFAFHGIQNADEGPGASSNFYLSVKDFGSPNGWQCGIGSYVQQQGGMDQAGYVYRGDLHFNEWYRFEGHIHWYGHGASAPVKWEIRAYDAGNNLVLDEDDFVGYSNGVRLSAEYANGKRMNIDGVTNSWFMGNNGPGGGTGSGRMQDISCVALGSDASVWGPVTGRLPEEKIAPLVSQTFPANNATNALANVKTWVTLRDGGLGLDTNSIVMKVNGSTVVHKRGGTIWNSQISYQPAVAFLPGAKVTVEVRAQDLSTPPNAMTPVIYSFTIAGTSGISRNLANGTPTALAGPAQAAYNLLGQTISLKNEPGVAGIRWLLIKDERNGVGARRMLVGQ